MSPPATADDPEGIPGSLPSEGDRVPSTALPLPGGGHVPLRHMGREATVLVRLHDGSCTDCLAWVEELDGAAGRFRDWYARLLVVVPGTLEAARKAASRVESDVVAVVADPEEEGPTAGSGGPAALVFDRFGEVWHAEAVEGHDFPDPDEIRSWLVYLATQCPECGVPDRP